MNALIGPLKRIHEWSMIWKLGVCFLCFCNKCWLIRTGALRLLRLPCFYGRINRTFNLEHFWARHRCLLLLLLLLLLMMNPSPVGCTLPRCRTCSPSSGWDSVWGRSWRPPTPGCRCGPRRTEPRRRRRCWSPAVWRWRPEDAPGAPPTARHQDMEQVNTVLWCCEHKDWFWVQRGSSPGFTGNTKPPKCFIIKHHHIYKICLTLISPLNSVISHINSDVIKLF